MGVRDRLILGLCVALVCGSAACKRKAPPTDAPPPPPDKLAPNEVPLSKEKAFALSLPRGAKIGSRWGGDIHVATELSPEQLANFVRQRVTGGKITAGSGSTRFEAVTVPAEPKRILDIDVRPGKLVTNVKSEMLVRDVTPVIDPAKLKTEEERWRAAGLGPDGHPLNADKLE
jgi:hypothetical protein